MGLGGIIAGAIGGLGQGMSNVGKMEMEDQIRRGQMHEQADLDSAKMREQVGLQTDKAKELARFQEDIKEERERAIAERRARLAGDRGVDLKTASPTELARIDYETGIGSSKDVSTAEHYKEIGDYYKSKAETERTYKDAMGAAAKERAGRGGAGAGKLPQTLSDTDKDELKENTQELRDLRQATLKSDFDPAKQGAVEKRINELQLRNQQIRFFASRGGDTEPTDDDIQGLLDRYKGGDGGALARFDAFFGKGSAQKILENRWKEIAPNGIISGAQANNPRESGGKISAR